MQDQVCTESGCGGLNNEYNLQDLSEKVRNPECACLLWRGDNYINQTKHDELCE